RKLALRGPEVMPPEREIHEDHPVRPLEAPFHHLERAEAIDDPLGTDRDLFQDRAGLDDGAPSQAFQELVAVDMGRGVRLELPERPPSQLQEFLLFVLIRLELVRCIETLDPDQIIPLTLLDPLAAPLK